MKFLLRKIFIYIFFILVFLANCFAKEDFSQKAVPIKIPKKKIVSDFSFVDKSILPLLEDGSAESLIEIVSKLRKSSKKYTNDERIVLYISNQIMKLVWTSVKSNDFSSVDISDLKGNFYISITNFALDGIYEENKDKNNFLSFVLPSLALLVESGNNDFYSDAEESLKKALSMKPDSVLANYLLGVLYEKRNQYEEACDIFSNINNSMCLDIFERLAVCYRKNNDFQNAKRVSEYVLSFNSMRNFEMLKICAESSFELKDFVSADKYVKELLYKNPQDFQCILLRAKILIETGDFIRASSVLNSYEKYDTQDKDYLLLKIKIQKKWKNNKNSTMQILSKALELYPDDLSVLTEAAIFTAENENELLGKSSEKFAEDILSIQPENITAKKIKINNFIRKKDWANAYKLSSSLITEMFDDDFIFQHIKICVSLKKIDEAWDFAKEFYEKDSTNENAIQSYISVLIAKSKKQEAGKLIAQLIPSSSSKMKSFLYYQKSLIDNRNDEILIDLRLSLNSNPKNEDALFRLYKIYYNSKDYRKAQFYLKQVISISPNDVEFKRLNANLDSIIKNGH